MTTTKRPALERPSFDELLPTAKARAAFEAKTAAFEAGRFVRRLRRTANLTQAQLAIRLDISQARVSAIESGEGSDGPSIGLLKRIVLACDLTWNATLGVEGLIDEKPDGDRREAVPRQIIEYG